jgi:hypothetical protein
MAGVVEHGHGGVGHERQQKTSAGAVPDRVSAWSCAPSTSMTRESVFAEVIAGRLRIYRNLLGSSAMDLGR